MRRQHGVPSATTLAGLIAVVLLLSPPTIGKALDNPQETIAARQSSQRVLAAALETINDHVRSGAPDRTLVTEAAETIRLMAKTLDDGFPWGSGPESGFDTAARREIWEYPEDFVLAQIRLVAEAEELVKVVATKAAGDGSALARQAEAVGDACANCHRSFRVRKN